MKFLNKSVLTMAVATAVTGVAILIIGGNSTVADNSKEFPAPPEGPFVVGGKAVMEQSPEVNLEKKSDAVAGTPPVMPEAPQKSPTLQSSNLAATGMPPAPTAPESAEAIVPASESLSTKKLPAKLVKPEALQIPEHAIAFPKVDPVVQAVPDAPESTVVAPIAPVVPKVGGQVGSAEVNPPLEVAGEVLKAVTNKQMPIIPAMPQMQSPIMAPDMQMKIHRPVMDTGVMQLPAQMVMPAMPDMEMPPQLPMPQPALMPQFILPAPPADALHQPLGAAPRPPVAPVQQENKK